MTEPTSGWVLRLPQTAPLSLNHRMHWAVKAKATKGFRDATKVLAKSQALPPLDYARVQLCYQPGTNRRRDVDSLVPTSKACLDGLRDAKVLPDDSPEYVDHLMPRILPTAKGEPALFLVVTATARPIPARVGRMSQDGVGLGWCS